MSLLQMLSRSSRLAYVILKLASRPLAGTLAALAVLLQAMFALPLAVRMAAETPCSAQMGGAMSYMDDHAMSHTDHQRPATPQLPCPHDQCPICHASPVSFGTLPIAPISVVTVFIALLVECMNSNSSPFLNPGSRFGRYRSRAPPARA